MGCGICQQVCPNDALVFDAKGVRIKREKCIACMACVTQCPTSALEAKGMEWELDDLVHEVLKDRNYFREDGGITVSGGECLLQGKFIKRFLEAIQNEHIHTAVDTAGFVPWDVFEKILPYADLVLYDLKLFDEDAHKKYAGVRNDLILENARLLAEYSLAHSGKPDLWIRTPIIPGISDSLKNVQSIGQFIAENLDQAISRWELLAFNNLCQDKYDRLDMDWHMGKEELMEEKAMTRLHEIASASGVTLDKIMWTGATKSMN
jgi:pyruvate formate lyase activating enzyme